ncbi:MAG TPA: energy transducer TonB [Pseudomonadales bacterium]|nr:energy transducer TonB [Pseudomonadales bacterium]
MTVVDYHLHDYNANAAVETQPRIPNIRREEPAKEDSLPGRILRSLAHLLVPVALGLMATTMLFYLMQALISSSGPQLAHTKSLRLVDFVRAPHLSEVQTKTLHPKKPPPPAPEPEVKADMNFNVKVDNNAWSMRPVKIDSKPNLNGAFSFASDGNYLPIVKVAPTYPTAAELRGLEGWVILQFTVDKTGRVIDPEVVENCARVKNKGDNTECEDMPNNIFNRSALQAAVKFRYKPKVVDGEPVATQRVRNKITFVLGDG